ncbi:MAG: FtsX-like permease family protein [Pseudomonadales bacterium]
MNVALDIALRYLRTGRRGYVSFITWVSVVGLFLGVLVLTVVVSVMNGFDQELRERLLRAIPHVVLDGATELPEALVGDARISAAFRYFETTAMVGRGADVQPVTLLGVDADGIGAMAEVDANMATGSMSNLLEAPGRIVLGAPLARHVGLRNRDRVTVTAAGSDEGAVRPVSLHYELTGTFQLGSELDYGLAIVRLDDVPASLVRSSGEHGVQLRLTEPMLAPVLVSELRLRDPSRPVSDWTDRYGDLFRAVQLEKAMMFVLLSLVVAVAAFNIVSGQVMLIREKSAAIAILRTMGARATTVSRIFLWQGLLIGLAGIGAGLLFGVWTALRINAVVGVLEGMFGVRFLEGTYYATIPVSILPMDLAIVGALSGAICLLAAWLPARRARDVHPVEGLHGF